MTPIGLGVFNQFTNFFLPDLPDVEPASAFLVDSRGRVIGGAGERRIGHPVADPALAGALDEGRRSGTVEGEGGTQRFVATDVPYAAGARLVIAAPEDAVFEPLAGPRRASWLLFAVFTTLLVAGLYALLRNRQRATALAVARGRLHDSLTGLPGWTLFTEQLHSRLADARTRGERVAVAALDLDHFRRVNDGLGVEVGDSVLIEVAERLRVHAHPGESVARIGGDEYALMLGAGGDEAAALERVSEIQEVIAAPLQVNGHQLVVTASAGLTVTSGEEERAEVVFEAAEAALHGTKSRGEPRGVFHPAVRARARERLELEAELRMALERDEIVAYYQPVVALADRRVVGVEALARWIHPERGLVMPAEFIPVAEDSGLIIALGRRILEVAATQMAAWREAGHALMLGVNLSRRELGAADLVAGVAGALERSGLDPEALCLEVTETAMMADPEAGVVRLEALKALGLCLAIDDFGVGYSSLSQITSMLPIRTIKIDRSFVARPEREREGAIVDLAIGLCRSLGLTSVGEGVETREQAERLERLGCELAQGFYFGRPQPAADLAATLVGSGALVGA